CPRALAAPARPVAMAAGEQFLLLHKANEDWWQVRRASEPRWARPFFVPATYVAEGLCLPPPIRSIILSL
uniref:RHG09 protein n=1 Tax=Accipiter nisus TaxID=211598 RepID=A0A8B9RV01_9AVES